MLRLLARKLIEAVVVLLLVTLGVTFLADLMPGSPASLILGDASQDEAVAALNAKYGWDDPFFERYGRWIGNALQGDLGESIQSNTPVVDLLKDRLPVTLQLALLTIAIALLIAIPLALYSASRQGGVIDRIVTAISSALFAMPSFVLSVVAAQVLAIHWQVFPSYGWSPLSDGLWENMKYAALPTLVLVLGSTPVLLRVLRADVVGILKEDYVLAARSKGFPPRYVLFRHVLRPASVSLVTLTGLLLGFQIGGSIIVEGYFSLPGVGSVIGNAVSGKDLPIVQGTVVLMALVYVVINTAVDLLSAVLDPRQRVSR